MLAFELICATLLALLLGTAIAFAGYRLFLVLLPLWGFFFGFGLGAQTVQVLFGIGFLATITSWAVGFVVGVLFAVFSYLFYIIGVGVLAFSLGYGLGYALMAAFGLTGFFGWIVGVVVGLVVAFVTLRFNLQKYVIILATAIGGSAVAIGTLLLGVGGVGLARLLENPIQAMLSGSPLLAILFLVMAVAGVVVQLRANRNYEFDPNTYQTWGETV